MSVYGFVIMPNHLHIIWEMKEMNGKELPHASFLKFKGHQFLQKLKIEDQMLLSRFQVDHANRDHSFWQRDSYAIELYQPKVIFQKLKYIHKNTCKGKWLLVDNPVDYGFSSFEFYETGKDKFGFLTHIGERL